MKSPSQPSEPLFRLASSQIGLRCLGLILYFDILLLISLISNSQVFRSSSLKDLLGGLAIVILCLCKGYVLLRMCTKSVKTRESVSFACLVVSVVIHQELNVQYKLVESEMVWKPTGRFYKESSHLTLGVLYLAINHWAHSRFHHFGDLVVVLYFSVRKGYTQIVPDLVSSAMCLGALFIWKLILDRVALQRGGFFSSSTQEELLVPPPTDRPRGPELDLLSYRAVQDWNKDESLREFDPELNHKGYHMLAYRNRELGDPEPPDVEPQPLKDIKLKDDRDAFSPSAKKLSAESYPIDYEWCFVFNPRTKKVSREYQRTQDREKADAFFHFKSQLESGKKLMILQRNIQSISDLQEEEGMQLGTSVASEMANSKQGFAHSTQPPSFRFDGFDPLLNRLLVKCSFFDLNELLGQLSHLYHENWNEKHQGIPFHDLINLNRQDVQKSKTSAGKGSYEKIETLIQPPSKTQPLSFDEGVSRPPDPKFMKAKPATLPETLAVQINCLLCLRIPKLLPPDVETQGHNNLKSVPIVLNSTIVPYFSVEELPDKRWRMREVEIRIYLKQYEVKTDKSVTLLNHLSHEVRSPLIATLGLLRMFIQHARDLPAVRAEPDFEKLVENYLTQGIIQINNLLDACQLILELTKTSKDSKIKPTEFNLKKLVIETTKLFTFLNSRRDKVNLVVDCPLQEEGEYVKSDPIRIRQILINLISNALKYTLEGEVRILVSRNSFKDIMISVIDTGIGIKQENLDKLFKEFGRIKSKEDEQLNGQGVGLGLNLSNQLAYSVSAPSKKTGIEVKSEYHRGSSFSFQIYNYFDHQIEVETFLTKYIPPDVLQKKIIEETGMNRSRTQAQARKLIGKMQTMRRAENVQVMLVDDSEHNLEFVEILFANLNIKVESYSNPQQALKRVRERMEQDCPKCSVFDMILVDYEMPFMTGAELALSIRLLPQYQSTPIICFSAQEILLGNDINKGITTCMLKPISNEDIQGLVDKYISPKSPHNCNSYPKFSFEVPEPDRDHKEEDADVQSNELMRSTGEDKLFMKPDAYQTTCFQSKPQNLFRLEPTNDSVGHKRDQMQRGSASSSKPTD